MSDTDDESVSVADMVAFLPDNLGTLTVITIVDFLDRLNNGETYDDAILNSGIDQFTGRTMDDLTEHGQRIDHLNRTGDADAYWA